MPALTPPLACLHARQNVSVSWTPTAPYPFVLSLIPRCNEPVSVWVNVTEEVNGNGEVETFDIVIAEATTEKAGNQIIYAKLMS
ncbi:hypothetical protein KAU25_02465 [Candidatus Bathyarchaeota archaeon]|nr:hypothetical protein [Candidatus Bathyarchaeota archaeon]